MIIRLLKSYTLNTGKKLPIGKIFRIERKHGEKLISEHTAEKYEGPILHEMKTKHKMKTNFFKPNDKWQQQA